MTNMEQQPQTLEPVQADEGETDGKQWSRRLVLFLRVMAGLSLLKGLYHWAVICGIGAPFPSGFDSYPTPYQVATVFFAIIDPVAAVGLWLAAPIFGGNMWLVAIELLLLGAYLGLALMATREQAE
jgi:Family of unknown function (DUF6163)